MDLYMFVYTYIHACMHTYIHTYIHTHINPCVVWCGVVCFMPVPPSRVQQWLRGGAALQLVRLAGGRAGGLKLTGPEEL